MTEAEKAIDASTKRRLAEFLVGNKELDELSARLNQFNILRVLRIERAEIRHSNVLGWLLSPRESHGLSDTFIRRFISTLLLDNGQADFGLSPATVELMDLVDAEVRREWRNIDLIVYSKSNQLVILIENKIRSKESEGQLRRYKAIARQSFPGAKILIPVLLTLEGGEPSESGRESGYIPWSHAALYRVATEVVGQQQHRIAQDAQIFLRHYLETLRKETMQDKELEDLCKAIYKRHKEAIDLIVRYGAATAFGEAAENFIREHDEVEQLAKSSTSLWFIPKAWARVMPKSIKNWPSPYPVALWFYMDQRVQKMSFALEIGPLSGTEQRRLLVETFGGLGFKATAKALRETAKYTRIYSRIRDVSETDDSREIKQVMDDFWQQSTSRVSEATKVVMNFGWED
ncbi:MAG TPA: PD-(D/E)XK nuclease family protein [Pyrinomonadaceae bacterium]|nr:PD-(D/E)XK nuclease family protein [Pyrinomonadaceae bacterium]